MGSLASTEPTASTRYTLAFVAANLPASKARILEIGCGDGALAARLAADGHSVTAIDSEPGAVEAARAAGVDARLIAWPADLGETYDAILFTRSLHHIPALDEAVTAARNALRPGGKLIVEDFRAEGGGPAAASWFADLAGRLIAEGALDPGTDLSDLLEKLPRAEHDHDLHPSSAIADALGTAAKASDSAYYFRYLEPHLKRPSQADDLLDEELALIGAGSIEALGKRFVVTLP